MEKLDKYKAENTYGGFAWMSLIPLVIESIIEIISAVKAFTATGKASIKTKQSTVSWEPAKQAKVTKPSYVY